MELQRHLASLSKRYHSKTGRTIEGYETENWPVGRVEELVSLGYLKPLPDADCIRCPGCGKHCRGIEPVKEIAKNGSESYMVLCETEGCVDIDAFYLQQWEITEKIKQCAPSQAKTRKRKASCELSQSEQQVYRLIHVRGLTQAQAAMELGCSVQNVCKHLGNAEKKIAAKAASRSISQSKKIPEDNRGQLNVGKRVIDED